jgi:HTH-type transcriptional regulator / antitoxin HigA
MPATSIIANDRQEREASALIAQITHALSSEQVLKSLVEGLPAEVIEGVRRSLTAERKELIDSLEAYRQAQDGVPDGLKARAGNDVGAQLIAARVVRGWKQKDLARRLFIPDQQVQRYEAENYRNITLDKLIKVARALGVRLTADIDHLIQESWLPAYPMARADVQKVLKHAREHGWLESSGQSDESAINQLRRTVADHVGEFGTPSLLRAGMNVARDTEDWLLLAWKAQVTITAKKLIAQRKSKYRPLDVSWLKTLVQLSALEDGPLRAKDLLAEHGITLVAEPQIAGLKVDGAAFLVDDMPVIGMTLRRDYLDNFWFTLLHEVAHVILHYRSGLASGFFDDVEHEDEENATVDEMERQANEFASNLLIPSDLWKKSPARIAKTAEPIERLAKQLGISPAVVFGRIRMERRDYKLFADKVGRGKVRKQFCPQLVEEMNEPAI